MKSFSIVVACVLSVVVFKHTIAAEALRPGSCMTMLCMAGTQCVEKPTPRCVPIKTTPAPTTECPLRKCATIYAPVCDSNGMTHSNECIFLNYQCKNPNVKLAYKGECKVSSPGCKVVKCSAGYECVEETVQCLITPCPVIAKCVPVTTAPPKTTKPCILAKCIDIYEPVCGSDGITYASECIALYSDCERQQSGFTIAHKGAC